LVHGVGSSFTIRRQDVSVYISRHSYGCVSEDLANYLQFDATREHQACRRMTQFMRMPVVKSSSLADDCEVSIEVSRIHWRAKIRRKDEASIGPEIVYNVSFFLLALSVLQEQIHQASREVH
jgi:hypothetical protein